MSEPIDDMNEIEMELPEDSSMIEGEDGSLTIQLNDQPQPQNDGDFVANLVSALDQSEVTNAALDLIELVEDDKRSREPRDKQYEEGLRRTGLGKDAPGGADIPGASTAVHPVMLKAAIDFAAGAMREIFPPDGPCKQKIIPEATRERQEKAERIEKFVNWQTTVGCPEFRDELERMLSQVPLGGSQYFKGWWDAGLRRPVFGFIPIDDIYLPRTANSFFGSHRVTHRQVITQATFDARVKSGMYAEGLYTQAAQQIEQSKAKVANDKIEGVTVTGSDIEPEREIYEVYCRWAFEGDSLTGGAEAPYIITIDVTSQSVLSIYRNWDPDERARKYGADKAAPFETIHRIIEFPFIPWRGAYAAGLPQMIGSLSGALTGIIRALLDSGHINNMPTLMTFRDVNLVGQTQSLGITQVNQFQAPAALTAGGPLSIGNLIQPIPFNPPSPVLLQLLGILGDEAGSLISASDGKITDAPANAPVGTVQAIIEQGARVKSAIHARLHHSMQRVLDLLFRLNRSHLSDRETVAELGDLIVSRQDFEGPMDVVPVSDPNIFSETQRMAQNQSVMALSTQAPELYIQRAVHERMLKSMRIPNIDEILKPVPPEPQPTHPSDEVVSLMLGKPVAVEPTQNHWAHLSVLIPALNDPLLGSSALFAPSFVPAAMDNIGQRMAYLYQQMMGQMVQGMLKQQGVQLSPEMVKDPQVMAAIAQAEAQAMPMVTQQLQQLLGDLPQRLTQAVQSAVQAKDMVTPLMLPPMPAGGVDQGGAELAQAQTTTGLAETQRKAADDQMDAQIKMQELDLERQKMEADHLIALQRLDLDRAKLQQSAVERAQSASAPFQFPGQTGAI